MASQPNNPVLDNYSKTQQLIYRISYRNHKKKLNQIKSKPQNTSLQFYNSAGKKPEDKKKLMIMKMKKQQIQMQNQALRKKIQRIRDGNKTTNTSTNRKEIAESMDAARKTTGFKNNGKKRYDNEKVDKIEMNSDCQGQSVKCFIPGPRNKNKFISQNFNRERYSSMFQKDLNQKHNVQKQQKLAQDAHKQQQENENKNTDGENSDQQPQNRDVLNRKLSNYIRKSSMPSHDALFNHPQQQPHRLVVFKKTKIPQPFSSFLIEISIINKCMLITAFGMGVNCKDYRLLLDKKKTKVLYQECDRNYEIIWQRVTINPQGMKISGTDHHAVKFQTKNNENEQASPDKQQPINKQQKLKQKKMEIQNNFLQRNYYTLLKQIKQVRKDGNNIHSLQSTIKEGTSLSKDQSSNTNKGQIRKGRDSYVRKKIQTFLENNPQMASAPTQQVIINKKANNSGVVNKNRNAVSTGYMPVTNSNKILVNKSKNNGTTKNQNTMNKNEQNTNKQPVKKINKIFNKEHQKHKVQKQPQQQLIGQQAIEDEHNINNNGSVSGLSEIKKINSVSQKINQNDLQKVDNQYQEEMFDDISKNQSNNINANVSAFTKKNQPKQSQLQQQYVSEYESIPNNSNLVASKKLKNDYQQQFQEQVIQNYSQQFNNNSQQFNNNSSVKAVKKAPINKNTNKSQIVQEEYLDEDFQQQ